jgi:hypothetical protein
MAKRLDPNPTSSRSWCTEPAAGASAGFSSTPTEAKKTNWFRFSACDSHLNHTGNNNSGGLGFPHKNDTLLPDNPIGTQQGALFVGCEFIFVVNAGCESFSQFKIKLTDITLTLLDVTAIKGCFPCSLDDRVDLGAGCVGTTCAEAGLILPKAL